MWYKVIDFNPFNIDGLAYLRVIEIPCITNGEKGELLESLAYRCSRMYHGVCVLDLKGNILRTIAFKDVKEHPHQHGKNLGGFIWRATNIGGQ